MSITIAVAHYEALKKAKEKLEEARLTWEQVKKRSSGK